MENQIGSRKRTTRVLDHRSLAERLNQVHGKVALSYYPYPELEHWYPKDRWNYVSWTQRKPSAAAAGQEQLATEFLLCNYELPTPKGDVQQQNLWGLY